MVKGLFSFIMSAAHAGTAAAANRIDFINKDNTGGVFLGFGKQVTDTRGTNADEHFNELRPGNTKVGYIGLASYCPGQQGLTGAGRTDQQYTFRNTGAHAGKFLRVL